MKYLPFLSLALFITSCSSVGIEDKLSLYETTDTLIYQLPSDVSINVPSLQVYTDGNGDEYLYLYDRDNCRLLFYDIGGADVVRTIQLEPEGANGIGRVSECYVKNLNEVYLPCNDRLVVNVVDSMGAIKRKYDLSGKDISTFHSRVGNEAYIIGDRLYSIQFLRRNMETEGYLNSPSEIVMDLSTGEIELSPCLFPKSYLNEVVGKPLVDIKFYSESRCFNGHDFIYSYYGSEELSIMSADFKKVSTKAAPSRYISEIPIVVSQDNMEMFTRYRRATGEVMYGKIVYDPYRRLYYRFAYPETEVEEKDSYLLDLWQNGRNVFSIIILDEDLNVIGETLFPRDRFRSNLYFVCKDGFYISCNHYKNPGYTDDELQFVKFEVKGK